MLTKKIAAAALSAVLLFPGVAHAQGQDEVATLDGIIGAALDVAGSEETRALLEGALDQVTSPESKEMVRDMIGQLPPEQRDALLESFDQVWDQLTDAGKLLLSGYSEQLRAIEEYGPDSFEAAFTADMSNRQRLTVIDAAANGDEGAKAALQDSNVQRVRSEVADSTRVDDDESSRGGSRSGNDDDSSTSSRSSSSGGSGGSRGSGSGSADSSSGGASGGSGGSGGGASDSASGGTSDSENSNGSGASGDGGGSGGAAGAAPASGDSGAQGDGSGAGDVAAVSGDENSAAPGAGGANGGDAPDEDAGEDNEESTETTRFQPPPEGQAGVINAPGGRAIQTEDGGVVSISSIQSPDDPLYQSLSEEDQQYVATRRADESRREYNRGVDQTTEELDGLHDESGQGMFNRRGESLATYEAQRDRVTDGLARDEENLQAANEWSEAAGRTGNIRERSYAGGAPEERINEMDRSRRYNPNNRSQSTAPETPPETTETADSASTQPAEDDGNENS